MATKAAKRGGPSHRAGAPEKGTPAGRKTKKTVRDADPTASLEAGRTAARALSSAVEGEALPSVGRPGRSSSPVEQDRSGDFTRLSEAQKNVLADVAKKSRERSSAARAELVKKAKAAGYTEPQLDKVLDYIKTKAPLVICFHPDKGLTLATRAYGGQTTGSLKYDAVKVDRTMRLIDAFLADTEYRNQFETGISSGSTSAYPGGGRDGWEKKIFEGGYHPAEGEVVAQDRPKYGAMNAHKLVQGPAPSYGTCMLIMKAGVRKRSTFTPKNSSGCGPDEVGTVEDFQHLLLKTSHFDQIMKVGLGKEKNGAGNYYPYIEMQVHGPVDFAEDVAELQIDSKHKGTPYEEKLLQFAEQNKIPVTYHS